MASVLCSLHNFLFVKSVNISRALTMFLKRYLRKYNSLNCNIITLRYVEYLRLTSEIVVFTAFIVVFTAFCSGEVIEKEGSHWTQMEQSAFPEQGKFYCGDCCGQHLAWKTCTDQWQDNPPGCINWVQCFQKECRVRFRSFIK